MKHVDLFNDFLKDTVNLNDTRVTELEESIDAIKGAVRASDWEPHLHGWMEQGSWAHKTIIRPVDQGEFDADLIIFVQPVDGWTAKNYIETLLTAFKANKTYKDMVKPWSHCVTVTYANDKKIDIAPCVANRGGINRLEVCNRDADQFERSEPKQFTDWLIDRNSYSGSNSFRKVTRLIKYLRDIKTRFTCSSVLLTTILGYRIYASDKNSDEFADTPTALKTIFGRMDDWLQVNPIKPTVTNPFLATENFAEAWTDDQYANFRERIHAYRQWIDEAFDEEDRSESIAKWRRVFGDDFASGIVFEEGKSVSKTALAVLRKTVGNSALITDLVDAVKQLGTRALPVGFNKKPYMQAPLWPHGQTNLSVRIRADLCNAEYGQRVREINSLDPLPKHHWVHFRAVTNTGMLFDRDIYRVEWRVTNTDEAAWRDNCLRGGFYRPESDNSRWERLLYRGVHLVEAFVIRKRGEVLVGQSDPFRVMIE